MFLFCVFGLFVLVAVANGYTTFDTTCTVPSSDINFVSAPNARSTLQILWSCLFTLLACTWTVLHLNVPQYHPKPHLDKSGSPGAWDVIKLEWGLDHIRTPRRTLRPVAPPMLHRQIKYSKDVYYLNARNIIDPCWKEIEKEKEQRNQTMDKETDEQTAKRMIDMSKLRLEPDEIKDRSKEDLLMRVIAVGQIIWVVTQVIARAVRHLAVTQLEVAVVAFALCAILMYWLNRHKPKGVGLPVLIPCYKKKVNILKVLGEQTGNKTGIPPWSARFRRMFLQFVMRPDGGEGSKHEQENGPGDLYNKDRGKPISNGVKFDDAAAGWSNFRSQFADLSLILGGMVFGGVHLVAWDFAFPTRIEQILWRAAAAWCVFFPFVAVQFFYVDTIHRRLFSPILRALFKGLDKFGLANIPLVFVPERLRKERLQNKEKLTFEPRWHTPSCFTLRCCTLCCCTRRCCRKTRSAPDEENGNQPIVQRTADSKLMEARPGSDPESSTQRSTTNTETGTQPNSQETAPNTNPKSRWEDEIDLSIEWFFFGWTMFLLVIYVIARLFLVVEMLRALAYLPPDAYYGTWGSNLPGFD
ncbi:hypothetical protein BO78DRAFT_429302 [Aspergillus sclerotiicarbonarius CBS 121057]|uniref:Uncharacterized protein n=1 Tax=Aspergillus sclerotiicarbonarius (strain CBS 121057 / IBT 28362) TaxID=1448318 RepID=A0A319EXT2_ASPSB|nr:hypothetical protein BO78DRAFT_429302 [Aspergillus sclerotiicarbonarius CBS 121057]